MDVPIQVRSFWDKVRDTTGYDASERFYEAFRFDDNERDANELAKFVLAGTNRATAGLPWSFEVAKKPLPKSGVISMVTNRHFEPPCVIETTNVSTVPFEEVTESFAATEGEGDKTLHRWRQVHSSYFGRECERIGKEPSLQMLVACEKFSLIYSPTT